VGALQLFRQDDFTGGLNLRADQFKLAPNESPDMLNVEVDPRGGLFSRGAMRRINPDGVLQNFLLTEASDNLVDENGNYIGLEANPYWHPRSMFPHYDDTHYLMLSTAKVDALLGGVYYSVGSNFTKLNVDVYSDHGACFASWGRTLYFTTGKGHKVYSWNGSTLTAIAKASQNNATPDFVAFANTTPHIPSAEHVVYHAGRLFVADITNYVTASQTPVDSPNMIRWSNINEPTKWTETDQIEIFGNGDKITSMVSFAGVLVIFKRNAIYVLTGDGLEGSEFSLRLITNKVGAATHEAVAVTERAIYFFCWPDGLFAFTGEGVIDLFEPIRPILLRGEVNPTQVNNIFVSYINRRIWVSLPYSATATVERASTSFVYDPSINGFSYMGESFGVDDAFKANGTWVKHQTADGWGVSCGCTFITTQGNIINAAAHAAKDIVLNVDVLAFEADNINGTEQGFTTYYRTRWVDGENYSQKKMWRRPDFVLRQEPSARVLDFRVYHDYEESAVGQKRQFDILIQPSGTNAKWGNFNWGENTWGTPNEGSFVKSGSNLGLARAVQLEIVGEPGLSWGMDSMTLKYNSRRVKG
jgi:hypothetical protein